MKRASEKEEGARASRRADLNEDDDKEEEAVVVVIVVSSSSRRRRRRKRRRRSSWSIGSCECAAVRGRSSTEVTTSRSPEFIRVSRSEELVQSALSLRPYQ